MNMTSLDFAVSWFTIALRGFRKTLKLKHKPHGSRFVLVWELFFILCPST